ncbi:hypothetical protein WJX72_009617 [[Myrmecia] bisecta]|uniref:Uncharacterized protein n=1 Tax=[Myrmecia] bisecta TaxID=41462 RepID=A0AAW1R943_9CHLO
MSSVADRPPPTWRRKSNIGQSKSDVSPTKVQASLSPRAVLPPLSEASAGSSPEPDRHLQKNTTWPRSKSSELNSVWDGPITPFHDPGNLGTATAVTNKLASISLSKPQAGDTLETIKASWHEADVAAANGVDDDVADYAEDQPLTARARKMNSAFSDQADSPSSSRSVSRASSHRRHQSWAGTPSTADKGHRRTSSGGEALPTPGAATPLPEDAFSDTAAQCRSTDGTEPALHNPATVSARPPPKNAIAYPVSQGLKIVRKSQEPELISWDEIKAQKDVYQAVTTADGLHALVKAPSGVKGSVDEKEYEVLLVADGPRKPPLSLVESVTQMYAAAPAPPYMAPYAAGYPGPASPPSSLARVPSVSPATPVISAPPNTPMGGVFLSPAPAIPTPQRQSSLQAGQSVLPLQGFMPAAAVQPGQTPIIRQPSNVASALHPASSQGPAVLSASNQAAALAQLGKGLMERSCSVDSLDMVLEGLPHASKAPPAAPTPAPPQSCLQPPAPAGGTAPAGSRRQHDPFGESTVW